MGTYQHLVVSTRTSQVAKAATDLRSLARTHTEAAVRTLSRIMRQPKSPPAARVAAASALLDRGWGKPDSKTELHVIRKRANELPDDELANIAVGGGDGVAETPIDPSQLN